MKITPRSIIAISIILVIVVYCSYFFMGQSKIVKYIGLEPFANDLVEEGFSGNNQIIYINNSNDPRFFENIVSKVERFYKGYGITFRKTNGIVGYADLSKYPMLDKNSIIECVSLKANEKDFSCYITNGVGFVVINVIYG